MTTTTRLARLLVTFVTKMYARPMPTAVRGTRLWFAVGIVAVVFGLMPILDSAGRIAVIVAARRCYSPPISRTVSPRTGDGDPRSPQDRPWPPEG